uniref:WRKY domain-containing protein n=1 Tax=Oryza punctata TaxID=4537 RepID=A0A0E0KLQ2_ORYPU
MDMMEEEAANAATAAQAAAAAAGDLADVVARANARAFLVSTPHHHHSPLHPLPMPPPHQYYPAAQITIPYLHQDAAPELRRPTTIAYADAAVAVPFEAGPPSTVVDSYHLTPGGGGYGMPRPLAVQISQHALCSGGGGAGAADDGEDAIRISPLTPSAHHQMMKRKNEVKKVVCIPAPPATSGRGGGGEVIPSDLWAWRKYGQKPIKGSPYPRGYYRCSSSKGCMARKQVERSRSDPNMLVITYTAEHNHPWPMQRNLLAGYARSHHTHATSRNKQQQQQTIFSDPAALMITSSSSSSSSPCNLYADVLGGQQAAPNMMMTTEAGTGPSAADEVFAELEELEPDNPTMINANMVYSMTTSSSRPGVSSYDHQWHKF